MPGGCAAACYHAGLPMVTLYWVRKPHGLINSNGLRGRKQMQAALEMNTA